MKRAKGCEVRDFLEGLQAERCRVLLTRAKVHYDHLGQSVPDVVNDTLLDPDLTRALCILHYQTPGSLKLHYLAPSPHPEREIGECKGKRKGNLDLTPSLAQRVLFPSGQAYALYSAPHYTAHFCSPLVSSSSCFLSCKAVKHNSIRVQTGTPKMILPAGFGERY